MWPLRRCWAGPAHPKVSTWSFGSSCTAAACGVCTIQTAPALFVEGLLCCSKKLLLLVEKTF